MREQKSLTVFKLSKELRKSADKKRAKSSLWFFKTGKGQYGEGDKFLGVKNDILRKLAKQFCVLSLTDIHKLLESKYHEERQVALFILVEKFDNGDEKTRKEIYDFYLEHTDQINNWDLVDCSSYKIVGRYLFQYNFGLAENILLKLALSKSLWERRIAIISTFYFIQQKEPSFTLKMAEILLNDKEDLIHKAVGWMLREVGKRLSIEEEKKFLDKHYRNMPRTMLRYSIEKFPEIERKKYLNGQI